MKILKIINPKNITKAIPNEFYRRSFCNLTKILYETLIENCFVNAFNIYLYFIIDTSLLQTELSFPPREWYTLFDTYPPVVIGLPRRKQYNIFKYRRIYNIYITKQ